MMFVVIVNGHIPTVHTFFGEEGKTQSVNVTCYLEFLQDVAWPALKYKAGRKSY